MRTIYSRLVVLMGALALALAMVPGAFAQCGLPMKPVKPAAFHPSHTAGAHLMTAALTNFDDDDRNDPSIVGLWHVKFLVDGQVIQEAFQIWNQGGTEVHNPNVPSGGGVCLGTWKQVGRTFKLVHRVWLYPPLSMTFLGLINVSETLTLSDNGNTQTGTFIEDFYDPSGNFQMEVTGNVTGTRISVE